MLQAGKLNTRVHLQKQTKERDEYGDEHITYVPAGKAWAHLEPISNRKIREQGQKTIIETWLIVMRPRNDITPEWKIEAPYGTYTVRNVDRSKKDRVTLTAEVST